MKSTITSIFLVFLFVLTTLTTATQYHQHPLHARMSASKSLNVFKKPLALHSTSPMTGFMRNGYCEVPPSDSGNHSVAAEVSDEFLDFSAKRGNDLRQVGLTGGCKWCLCVSRWREAFDARGQMGDKIVPKIFLNATNEQALSKVSMDELKQFAVDKEA